MAVSAARSSSSAVWAASGRVATPIEAVRRTDRPSEVRNVVARMRSRIRSGDRHGAFRAGVGQDQREFVAAEAGDDVGFTGAPADHGAGFDQRLAARQVPVAVVDLLEAVEVEEQQRQRAAAAHRALGFAAQHQVQVARVVQPRQVVGDRQRLCLLERQRVVERNGGRLEQSAQRQQQPGAQRRRGRRRLRVDADQHPDQLPAADQRKRDHRAVAAAAASRVLARSAESSSEPWRITQSAADHSAGPSSGFKPTSASTVS